MSKYAHMGKYSAQKQFALRLADEVLKLRAVTALTARHVTAHTDATLSAAIRATRKYGYGSVQANAQWKRYWEARRDAQLMARECHWPGRLERCIE